jgi:hypothetical protein
VDDRHAVAHLFDFGLLIACANAASLLLLRTERRGSEFATRRAMGATPWQLMVPLIAEAATLTGLGAVGGVATGRLATYGLQRVAPVQVLAAGAPWLDWRLALFDVAVSAGALLVSVLLPALRASRPNVSLLVRGEGAGQDLGQRTRRARTALVGCECATAVLLLACAALFGRTVFNLVNSQVKPSSSPFTRMKTFEPSFLSGSSISALPCATMSPFWIT